MALSPTQEIKERIDIADFIRSYIPLQLAGKNLKANCPFHKEKTPSFIVSPDRQTWHCFGSCGEGGDIFKFLMKYENLEFYEALKILAEKAGIELKKISPAEHKQFGILYEINESAKDFFRNNLWRSADSLKYLKDRGLKKETVEEFEIGLSLNDYDLLTRHLIKAGYDIKDVERAGLNFKTERGSYIDRFRQRIMFPLYDHFGKVVGFSGRILPQFDTGEMGKYVNSPETAIFNKSKLLYGFHKTKNEIRKQKSAVLVEGQMDFLAAYQDGVQNAVATSGTALTLDHLKTLRRGAEELILYFDNDEAGQNAAERAIDLAGSEDFNVKLLVLKDYKDPSEAAEKSPGILLESISQSKPVMKFYFERYLENENTRNDIGKFKRNLKIILGKIKNLASPVERSYWLKELSIMANIGERELTEEMSLLKTQINISNKIQININNIHINSSGSRSESAQNRREMLAERLLGLMSANENFRNQISDYEEYLPPIYLSIFKNFSTEEGTASETEQNMLNSINLQSSFRTSQLEEEKIEQEFHDLLKQLRLEYLKEKRLDLLQIIKEAERDGGEVIPTLKEFDQISKLIHNI